MYELLKLLVSEDRESWAINRSSILREQECSCSLGWGLKPIHRIFLFN